MTKSEKIQRAMVMAHSALFGAGVATGIMGEHLIGAALFLSGILIAAWEQRKFPV